MTNDRADRDWLEWHRPYDQPGSRLARRLAVVQEHIRTRLDTGTGPARIISMCAGHGRDLLGVLPAHPRRDDVDALLVELDPRNAHIARAAARDAGLGRVRVKCADASLTDVYADAVPADLVLACGIFGNISGDDVRRTVHHLPGLCAPNATVIWTRGRSPESDVTPDIRRWFDEGGFAELAFDAPDDAWFSVGVHRLVAAPRPLERGVRLFQFRE